MHEGLQVVLDYGLLGLAVIWLVKDRKSIQKDSKEAVSAMQTSIVEGFKALGEKFEDSQRANANIISENTKALGRVEGKIEEATSTKIRRV